MNERVEPSDEKKVGLSNSDRNRIRAEEIFRQEVHQQLEGNGKPTLKAKTWTFLNSALGVWFLSTIVLGAATVSYQSLESRRQIEAQTRELVRKLDLEISVRIGRAAPLFDYWKTDEPDALSPVFFAKLSEGELTGSVYPEFKGRELFGLMVELEALVPPQERPPIAGARRALLGLMTGQPVSKDAAMARFEKSVVLARWRALLAP